MSDNPYEDDLDDIRYGYADDVNDCDHTEYEVDWEGRATCDCGKSWWLTGEQYNAHMMAEAKWAEEYDRMQRRENAWWMRLYRWCRRWVFIRPFGNAQGPFTGDEIPF